MQYALGKTDSIPWNRRMSARLRDIVSLPPCLDTLIASPNLTPHRPRTRRRLDNPLSMPSDASFLAGKGEPSALVPNTT